MELDFPEGQCCVWELGSLAAWAARTGAAQPLFVSGPSLGKAGRERDDQQRAAWPGQERIIQGGIWDHSDSDS